MRARSLPAKPSAVLRARPLTSFALEVLTAHTYTCSQVPVQPVTAAGPEHSKPLEKAESLFNQERDPRFSEIYSNINTGREYWAVRPVACLPDFSFNPSALCSFLSHLERFWVQRLSVTVVWQPRSCRIALIFDAGWIIPVYADVPLWQRIVLQPTFCWRGVGREWVRRCLLLWCCCLPQSAPSCLSPESSSLCV